MEKSDAVAALAALAQDNRLDVFRLLVRAGAKGMPAGAVASALDLAPNTLSFHFDRLRQAGLVTCTRDGRPEAPGTRRLSADLDARRSDQCSVQVRVES